MQIEKTLVANKCLMMPQIYLAPDVEKLLTAKLKDIVKRHQGVIVDDPDNATHIVHSMPPVPDEGKACLTTLGSTWFPMEPGNLEI